MRETLICAGNFDTADQAFQNTFKYVKNVYTDEAFSNVNTADCVFLFRGGDDIHPSLYGEKRAPESFAPGLMSLRDSYESRMYRFAAEKGIPMLGICRGSQFLCAMNGGKLVQHVNSHGIAGTHPIITIDGRFFEATSTHHQMMYPWPIKSHKLIAWAAPRRSDVYVMNINDRRDDIIAEPEVVLFPKTRSLGIQGHPEYLTQTHPYTVYCNELVKEYLL